MVEGLLFKSDWHRRWLATQGPAHGKHEVVGGDVCDLEAARGRRVVERSDPAGPDITEIGIAIRQVEGQRGFTL